VLLIGVGLLVATTVGAIPVFAPNLRIGSQPASSDSSPLVQTVVCFGYVDVEHGVTPLYPSVPGRVVKVEVHESQSVEAGAALVRLEDRLAQLRLHEADADLEAAQAQLMQAEKAPEQHQAQVTQQRAAIQAAKSRVVAARIALDHKRDLHKAHYLTAPELEAAKSLVQEAEAAESAEIAKLDELQLADPAVTVRRAKADLEAKKARRDQARKALEECVIQAPTAGTVLRILVSPGELLGGQPQQPAVVFAPDGPRWIRADVTQEFASLMAPGQTAMIEDDSGVPGTWQGTVSRISEWYAPRRSLTPDPFHVNETRTRECLIQVSPEQPPLTIGQRMRVTIETYPPH
jgi:multidrug resistance efflux pump